jgi:hypothetical protein
MFTGPHGIGKSTTAKGLYRCLPGDYLFIPSFAGAVAKRYNFDLNKPFNMEALLDYQWMVLETFKMSYEITAAMNTIYDRSPIDFAVYATLALEGKPTYAAHLNQYWNACKAATLDYCDILIIPEADLTAGYENKGNRPEFNEAQIEVRKHYTKLVDDMVPLVEEKVRIVRIPIEHQNQDRVTFLLKELKENANVR